MVKRHRIIFRADGNSRIGLGHVTRSLALASMLRENFECVFAIQVPSVTLQSQINEVCHGIIILPLCATTEDRYIHELDAYISEEEIVVLDGYTFETEYQQGIKVKGAQLVCIDDIHAYHFVADIVISHVAGLKKKQFSAEAYTRFYLGASYALLREEFLYTARQTINRTKTSESDSVFICLGGADPKNHTLDVLLKCAALSSKSKYYVVLGAANKHIEIIQRTALSLSLETNLLLNLDAKGMLYYMKSSSKAITSASSVAYEYLCTHGILYLFQTADNQAEVYNHLIDHNIALPFDKYGKSLSADQNQELVNNSSKLFDGYQKQRLLQIFNMLIRHDK